MRIILRYCLPWGGYYTVPIEINFDAKIEEVRKKVNEKFQLPEKHQLLKFYRDKYIVIIFLHIDIYYNLQIRVVNGFTLDFYEINDNSIIIVEKIGHH